MTKTDPEERKLIVDYTLELTNDYIQGKITKDQFFNKLVDAGCPSEAACTIVCACEILQ